MKVLHYVNENNLSWGRSWGSLLKKLESLGVENAVVCKSGGTLSRLLRESSIRCSEADVLLADLPVTALGFAQALRGAALIWRPYRGVVGEETGDTGTLDAR